MIIVHNTNPESAEFTRCAIAGSSEEIKTFSSYVTAIGLQSIHDGTTPPNALVNLLDQLTIRTTHPIDVANHNTPTLTFLTDNSDKLELRRQDQLIKNGLAGRMGAAVIAREFSLLNTYGGGDVGPDQLRQLSQDGLVLERQLGQLKVYCVEISTRIDTGFYEDEKQALIKELPVTHGAHQCELSPDDNKWAGTTAREHDSIGTLDEQGRYVPYATILSADHPARTGRAGPSRE